MAPNRFRFTARKRAQPLLILFLVLLMAAAAFGVDEGDNNNFSLTPHEALSGRFTFPSSPSLDDGQPDFVVGKRYNITWDAVDPNLKRPRVMLELRTYVPSLRDFARRSILLANATNTGSYLWTVDAERDNIAQDLAMVEDPMAFPSFMLFLSGPGDGYPSYLCAVDPKFCNAKFLGSKWGFPSRELYIVPADYVPKNVTTTATTTAPTKPATCYG